MRAARWLFSCHTDFSPSQPLINHQQKCTPVLIIFVPKNNSKGKL
jgi:hypothetical protein